MEQNDKICENCDYMKVNYFGIFCENNDSDQYFHTVKWYDYCDKYKENEDIKWKQN